MNTEDYAEKEWEKLVSLTRYLLGKLEKEEGWSKEDEEKLTSLSKIVAIISKLLPFQENSKNRQKHKTLEEDMEIIKRFLEREKCAN